MSNHLHPAVAAGQKFRCALCRREFEADSTHEEAAEQYQRDYPANAAANDPYQVVCLLCFDLLNQRENQPAR